jgi:stress response protein YsnF
MPLPDIDTALDWRGRTVVDRDGEKIGKLDDLYLDEETSRPEWAGVATGVFGRRQTLVPLSEARLVDDDVQVPFDQDQVKDAPNVDPDEVLSQEEESRLYQHYGLEYSTSGSVLPQRGEEQDQESGEEQEQVPAQAQEQEQEQSSAGERSSALGVGTEVRPRERLRLKKYVVTEHVTRKVPISREEVRLEREPVDADAEPGADESERITEGEDEVVLREEEPVFDKENQER